MNRPPSSARRTLLLAALSLSACVAPLYGQIYDFNGYPSGVYKLTVDANGRIKIDRFPVIDKPPTVGDTPTVPTGDLKTVTTEATKAIPKSQENDILIAGMVIGVENIATKLDDGSFDKGEAADEWKKLLTMLAGKPDWTKWESAVSGQLSKMQLNDELETVAQWSIAFKSIATGIKDSQSQNAGLVDLIDRFRELLKLLGIDDIGGLIKFITDLLRNLP